MKVILKKYNKLVNHSALSQVVEINGVNYVIPKGDFLEVGTDYEGQTLRYNRLLLDFISYDSKWCGCGRDCHLEPVDFLSHQDEDDPDYHQNATYIPPVQQPQESPNSIREREYRAQMNQLFDVIGSVRSDLNLIESLATKLKAVIWLS